MIQYDDSIKKDKPLGAEACLEKEEDNEKFTAV
jgi:hypothetical protein